VSEFQLVTMPIVLPPSSELCGSTALVRAGQGVGARAAVPGTSDIYIDDEYAWSGFSDNTGIYRFQSVVLPFLDPGMNAAENGGNSSSVWGNWQALNTRNAVSQYLLHAAMPLSPVSTAVSVYC